MLLPGGAADAVVGGAAGAAASFAGAEMPVVIAPKSLSKVLPLVLWFTGATGAVG